MDDQQPNQPLDSIEELFAQTLVGDYDDEQPWKAVHALRRLGSREVFEYAVSWTRSGDRLRRARGLDVLAQLGVSYDCSAHTFPEESFAVVAAALRRERDIEPLSSAIFALGHIDDARAIDLVAPFHTHPDENIRYAVACAIGKCTEVPRALQVLLTLMERQRRGRT